MLKTDYKSAKELYFKALEFEKELILREEITKSRYSLTHVVILDSIEDKTYAIEPKTIIYDDVRENLVFFW